MTVLASAIVSAEPTVLFAVDTLRPSFVSSPSGLTKMILVTELPIPRTLVRFVPSP